MKFVFFAALAVLVALSHATVVPHDQACPATPVITNPTTGVSAPWPITQYCGQTSFFGGTAPLSQGVGYGIVVGFGFFFSIFTAFIVWLDAYFVGTDYKSSEVFNTAGRSVATGLTASVIVSQWTWAATLLQSSNVAYNYGVSGPYWYAAGATIQIFLFGILAIEIKRKAPTAHTLCEVVLYRWGYHAHKVFLWFALLANVIVTGMLILGGAAVVEALTGMNVYAASFLIPVGVILYTLAGGLKATFLASYIHTAVIFVCLVIFVVITYMTDADLGSPTKVYDGLVTVATVFPVPDNKDGMYTTMMSVEGLVFGIINIVGNFGTVFLDQSYWQSAIAAKPRAAHKGFIMGGLVWFTIPMCLATALGLAALALDLPITSEESGNGLVPPATAYHFMGDGGAWLILIMLFMAVTSTGSAELIAVSSLVSYDVYRVYFNPEATGKQMLIVGKITIVLFGCIMGGIASLLKLATVSLGWVYLGMGVIIGSAVIPCAYVLLWSRASALGAIVGAFVGQAAGITAWLVSAAVGYDEVTLKTTGYNYPMLIGNLTSILGGGLLCTLISLWRPDYCDWSDTRNIPLVENDDPGVEESDFELQMYGRWVRIIGLTFTALMVVIVPCISLAFTAWPLGFFWFWVICSIVWAFIATIAIISLPLWEGRFDIMGVLRGIFTCQRATPVPKMQYEMPMDGIYPGYSPYMAPAGAYPGAFVY